MSKALSSRIQPGLSVWIVVIVFLFVLSIGTMTAGIKAKGTPPASATPSLLAFVTNENSNNVSVVDIATNTVVSLIPAGSQPVAAALTPDRSRLYVANFGDATVSVIDTATNTVATTVSVGVKPVGVTITPDGSKAYVANFASSSVSVIDIATNTVVATILTGNPSDALGSAPSSVVISPDGARVYVANFNLNTVSVIDAATNVILTTIGTGAEPVALAITQDGGSIYVANFGASSVTVIATATNSVTGLIPVGRDPSGVALTPDGASVYVTNKAEDSVSVITTALNVVTATVTVDTNPVGIAMAPDGATVYASNFGSNTVSAISVATNTVIGTIGVGDGPFGIAIPGALPPGIVKAFGAARIALSGTTSLTFTLTNSNITARLTGTAFTDNLPAGMVVASPGNLTSNCGGTATAADGSASVSLSGVTLAAGASCMVSVSVTGSAAGVKNNSVTVTSLEGGTGNTSNASLTVVGPPAMVESFGAAGIPLNGTTSLSFTINNPNSTEALTGIGFSDTLPAGLVISTPNGRSGSCGGGTITATQGTNVVSLAGASLASGASCSFSLNVTGIAAGTQNNTTGSVTSTEGGTGGTAFASVVVTAPPSLAQAFSPTNIALNTTSSLTFTIVNPAANVVALTGVAFSDTLPAGLTVANASSAVCGGTLTTTAPSGIILSGATVDVGGQCQFTVTVTGATSGLRTNTTGNVTSTNGGTGNASTAAVTVASAPIITEIFGVAAVPLNGTTSLTFTISNPNSSMALTGLAFTDNLPGGLLIAVTPGLTNTCGGTATATAGMGAASLANGTLAGGASCTVAVNVTGITVGLKNNSVTVTSVEGGSGNTSNATLAVATPPSIIAAFGAAGVPLNGVTSLTFTISNPNAGAALTGVAFIDNLPSGLVVASTPGLTSSCGGTATATGGSGVISLSGGTVAASASCAISVNVTGTTVGVKNNSVSVSSPDGGPGNTSSTSITVNGPAVIGMAFGAASIPLNGSTSLNFTINNPNAGSTLSGIGFTDTLPAGLAISTPSGLSGSCGGGAIIATAGTGVINLSGASLAAGASCSFSVNVTGTAAGAKNNSTGSVISAEGGAGATASAGITVTGPPVIAAGFSPVGIPLNGATTLTFTIGNPAANAEALTGVAFTNTLPAGLTVGSASSSVCGGTLTTTSPASIALSGAAIAVSGQCQFSVTVTGAALGSYANTTGNVSSANGGTGNTASSGLTVAKVPSIIEIFGAASIPLNGTTSLTFSISNPNTALALTGLAFNDSLPAGLVVASTPALTSTCGGTATAVSGSGSVSLSGGTVAANTSCTISVNLTGTTVGVKNNSVSVTSNEGGAGNTFIGSIAVNSPPVIAASFAAASIALNGTTTLTFNISNPNTGTALNGTAFTDTLPAGLIVAPTPNLNNTCGGTLTAGAGAGQVALSGVTVAASGSCSASVDVQGTSAGVKNNSVTVTSTEGGTGLAANASVTVVSGLRFVPVTPCRIADTRNPTGPFGGPFLSGQTSRGFNVPQSACGVPATAQAYSLNVTVVPRGTLGFLTMFPCGQPLPLVSTLNSTDGRVKAVAAIVPAGTNGGVCAFPSHDTDLVLDINGYFVPATDATALDFYPVTPCRMVDTRSAAGPLGGPSLTGNATRTFPVRTAACNIPAGAKAYSLNYTSIPKGPLGFLTTWPSPQPQPLVSTLNAPTGAITANAAIVPAGTNGDVSVFVTNDSDLVIDVNGYFAAPAPGGLSLFNVTPCRLLDTRSPAPTNGQPITSIDLNITTTGCGVPSAAQSYVLNATVVPPGQLGFITLWPQGAVKPLVSTLNAPDGAITSNMAIVPTTNGSISAFASNSTQLVLDISGYFAPSQPGGFGPTESRAEVP